MKTPSSFLERLKAKNLAVCNIVVRVQVEDFQKYGEIPALLMCMTENGYAVADIPEIAIIVTRPNVQDTRVIYRIMWRKDLHSFAKAFLEKELPDKTGAVPAFFHQFIQGEPDVEPEKSIIVPA